MNTDAKRLRVRLCVVCNFFWSDFHHLYRRKDWWGDPYYPGTGLWLCPNHHRCATITQAFIIGGWAVEGPEGADHWCRTFFDEKYIETVHSLVVEAAIQERDGNYPELSREDYRAMDRSYAAAKGHKTRKANARMRESWKRGFEEGRAAASASPNAAAEEQQAG